MKLIFKKKPRFLVSVFTGLALFYVFLSAHLYFTQDGHIYHPEPVWRMTPAEAGLDFENVSFFSKDGVKLSGWFLPKQDPKGTVLFFHGNAGNIASEIDTYLSLHELGYAVFAFDYRGYGQSEGRPSEAGLYKDAEGAWLYLTELRKVPQESIVFFGRSLGAAVAIDLASRYAPGGLVAEATFTSLKDIAAELYPLFPVRFFLRSEFNSSEKVARLGCPVLFVHSREDELIPYEHGRRLFAATAPPKQFLMIEGPHAGGYEPTAVRYWKGVARFLEEALRS